MDKPLPVNDTPRSFYTVIRAFALVNDIAVPGVPDLAADEMFGVKLEGPGWSDLAGRRHGRDAFEPARYDDQADRARSVWALNFKPAAENVWAFLSGFREMWRRVRCRSIEAGE